jgi:AmmeMemoRadiSam system protein B
MNRDDATYFLHWLKNQMDDETIVVVSSDLSHYRPKAEALSKTDEVEARLKANDSEFFWNANDSYTDNGKSLWLMSKIAKALSWSSIHSAASWNYGGSTLNTTTYIVGFWKK